MKITIHTCKLQSVRGANCWSHQLVGRSASRGGWSA